MVEHLSVVVRLLDLENKNVQIQKIFSVMLQNIAVLVVLVLKIVPEELRHVVEDAGVPVEGVDVDNGVTHLIGGQDVPVHACQNSAKSVLFEDKSRSKVQVVLITKLHHPCQQHLL